MLVFGLASNWLSCMSKRIKSQFLPCSVPVFVYTHTHTLMMLCWWYAFWHKKPAAFSHPSVPFVQPKSIDGGFLFTRFSERYQSQHGCGCFVQETDGDFYQEIRRNHKHKVSHRPDILMKSPDNSQSLILFVFMLFTRHFIYHLSICIDLLWYYADEISVFSSHLKTFYFIENIFIFRQTGIACESIRKIKITFFLKRLSRVTEGSLVFKHSQ